MGDRPGNDSPNVSPTNNIRQHESQSIIESETILQGHREVWIRHGAELYRLRLTSAGKLYLSK
ncbi:hemin uptake protein HemP [Rhodopirellula baltica]|nr:hemin uptake protein HemP [Rhodopirellula baltica]